MQNDNDIKGIAGKTGYCDAIMGRDSADTSGMGHYERLKYEAGYKAGKESGVVFFAAREAERQGGR